MPTFSFFPLFVFASICCCHADFLKGNQTCWFHFLFYVILLKEHLFSEIIYKILILCFFSRTFTALIFTFKSMIIPIPQNNWGFQHEFWLTIRFFFPALAHHPHPLYWEKCSGMEIIWKSCTVNSLIMDRILSPQQSCVEPLIPSTSHCKFIWRLWLKIK